MARLINGIHNKKKTMRLQGTMIRAGMKDENLCCTHLDIVIESH